MRRKRLRTIFTSAGTVLAILLVYVGSLLGYEWLSSTSQPLDPPDLGTVSDTVVLVTLEALHTTENRLDVKVLVLPDESLMDQQLDVLAADLTVRLYPSSDLGELQYAKGHVPSSLTTSIAASGDAEEWPFDSFTTDTISAEVLVGSGDNREFVPARVEVTGDLYGWNIRSTRSGPATQSSAREDDATITFERARGPLAFDLGICLVVVTLPALALFVAIETIRGRKKFQPAFGTWYAAMLFAIVPLRNVLPGAPPPGSWIDQAIFIWVLITLVAAMVTFFVAWFRHGD
ncbi:DUF4436 domain-containing protein [Mycobacterium sp. MMS18-G62]